MVISGVEVGMDLQLCFINKMEERSPSCVVSLDMDLFMDPFVVCAVHASRQSQSQPNCSLHRGASHQGARSRARCVGLKLTGQRTGVRQGVTKRHTSSSPTAELLPWHVHSL